MNKDQVEHVIQNYLLRLARRVYPSGDSAVVHLLSKDAFSIVVSERNEQQWRSLEVLRAKYSYQIPTEAMQKFMLVVDELLSMDSNDDVASYLIALDTHTGEKSESSADSEVPFLSQSQSSSSKSLNDRILPYYKEAGLVEPLEILRNLMFALIGSTSDLFPFEKDTIKIPIGLNYGEVAQMYELLEPCLILKSLTQIVYGNEVKSQTKMAFHSVIQEGLLKYTDYVNSINSQILEERDHVLTLRGLHLLLSDWIQRLKLFYYLEIMSERMESNEFVSLLDQLCGQGDPMLRELSKKFFQYCIKPFTEMIQDWTFSGELNEADVKAENFFISKRDSDKLVYQRGRVPSCLNEKQSYNIYQIGKCLNFLKNDCKEFAWCEQFREKYSHENSSANNIGDWNFEKAYQEIVHYCYREVICKRYDLIREMSNLHSFLLMGQGDFISALVLKASESLNQSTSSLSANKLIQSLQDSVATTSVKDHYDKSIVDRLDARILEMESYGTLGWEVFTLDFQLKFPLNKLFEADHKEYLRMFNFLFKLVRMSSLLNTGWSDANTLKRDTISGICKRAREVRRLNMDKSNGLSLDDMRSLWIIKTFKRLNILRSEFIKFMNVLMDYILFHVIDNNYKRFMDDLSHGKKGFSEVVQNVMMGSSRVKELSCMKMDPIENDGIWSKNTTATAKDYNLDELVELHGKYIRSISRCKILDNSSGGKSKGRYSGLFYIEQIYGFLSMIIKFVELSKEFNNLLVEMLSVSHLSEDTLKEDKYDEYLSRMDMKFNRLIENLTNEIINKFEDGLELFTKDLMSDQDEDLRFLGKQLAE
ncbi:hypothetical protein FOA43_004121 [Brettanomyces nanus]|uniref:Spindle pole body component n=1 Tax=Eeniella nana TaxID=13502 RepID=A0A875RX70_EENNA|nr:uncharacterized protein FOA43_004121 [Brettanomyces nanus]QPG76727.1 hypothetical protein FOA43_004121 [Brettanomyces nanus]